MRSGGSKRRRRRIVVEWKPILWVLLLGNVAFGLLYSRVTRLTRITVEGVAEADQTRIQTILASARDLPTLQINARNMEALVLDHPAVRTADLTRNIFGRGRLRLDYRYAVAFQPGPNPRFLSADGVLYRGFESTADLPVLRLPQGMPEASLALSSGWRGERVAWLAQEAFTLAGAGPVQIQVGRKGILYLYLGGGKVTLGGPIDLERKMEVLRSRLNRDPGELQRVEALVLTDPQNPVLVRRPERKPTP